MEAPPVSRPASAEPGAASEHAAHAEPLAPPPFRRESSYPGYQLIRLAAVSYRQAEKAADWKFTYDRNGVEVEVLNRNVLANAPHAYALYWSTPVSDWNAYYHYFQVFAATFQPAPSR